MSVPRVWRRASARLPGYARLRVWREQLLAATRAGSRREMGAAVLSLAGSGLIGTALQVVGGLVQGRFVGPELLGFFAKFAILPGFLFFLQLGIFLALARQYPYYMGAGDRERALRYARNALGWMCLIGGAQVVLFVVLGTRNALRGDWMAALGWGVQATVAPCALYMTYLGTTYRNGGEFVAWSRASLLAACSSILLLPTLLLSPVLCLCSRQTVPAMLGALYAHVKRPIKVRPALEPTILKEMIAFGAPFMAFGYVAFSLWPSMTSVFVLETAGERSLGLYGFASFFGGALTTVATSLSQVFQPRLAALYGSSNHDMKRCFQYSLKGALIGLVALLPLVALACWLLGPLVRLLLPKYADCVPYARWLCWLALLPVIDFPSQILVVSKRTVLFGVGIIVSFLLFAAPLALARSLGVRVTLLQIVEWTVFCKMVEVLIKDCMAWRLSRRDVPS